MLFRSSEDDRSVVQEVSIVAAGRAQRRSRMRWSSVRRVPEQDAWTIVLVVLFAIVGVFAFAAGLLYVAVTFTAGELP